MTVDSCASTASGFSTDINEENDDRRDSEMPEPNWLQFGQEQQLIETDISGAVQALSIFLMLWVMVFYVSRSAFDVLLRGLSECFNTLRGIGHMHPFAAATIPATEYQLLRRLGVQNDDFHQLIVCPRCHYNCFPDHTTTSAQCPKAACSAKLGKLHPSGAGGAKILKPFYTYSYKPLSESLQNLLQRPDFETLCALWEQKQKDPEKLPNMLYDVYDGELWSTGDIAHSLMSGDFYTFLLNFDFFPPYERSPVSTGCIYAVCLNLPREIRFERANMIIVGILPWMGAEPSNLNPYLIHLVDDLIALWEGMEMKTYKFPSGRTIRGAILGTSCDLPAARKLNGFKSFNAIRGCSKCDIQLGNRISSRSTRDYGSPFTLLKEDSMRDENDKLVLPWPAKTSFDHRSTVKLIEREKFKNKKEQLSKSTGFKECELLRLPYYDSVRMHTIDPMHLLYEGIAKHVFKTWVTSKCFKGNGLSEIDRRLKLIAPPVDFDRLPTKMSTNYNSFKAIQWLQFVVHYSPLLLTDDILSSNCIEYWDHFIDACRSITKTEISMDDLSSYTSSYTKFAQLFIREHGTDSVTPNMHMALHLEPCILDYGPIYGFWLFSFERYNGILGSFPTNGHLDIGSQLMRRFLLISKMENFRHQAEDEYSSILKCLPSSNHLLSAQIHLKYSKHCSLQQPIGDPKLYSNLDGIKLPTRQQNGKLSLNQRSTLLNIYESIYEQQLTLSDISEIAIFTKTLVIGRELFWSKKSEYMSKEAMILVNWRPIGSSRPHLATVQRFFQHKIEIGEQVQVYFVSLKPYSTQAPLRQTIIESGI